MLSGILFSALIYMAVLIIASMSGLISEKVGIINIAINGFMIIGALMYGIFSNLLKGWERQWTIVFAIILAILTTGLFSLLHGVVTIMFKADHVVSGTAINLLAAGLALFLTPTLALEITKRKGDVFLLVYEFDGISKSFLSPEAIIYAVIAVFIAASLAIYFKYTKTGLRHAAIGENPNAADSAAINVNRYKWVVVFFSGVLGGLAGVVAMSQINVFRGNVQGLGFIALAIMILGQWRISFITFTSFIFAFLWGYLARNKNIFGMPENFIKMVPFILSLVALLGLSKFKSAPQAVGQHFDKSRR